MSKEIDLKEIQKLEIDILDSVVEFCEEHGFCYFLAGGTLLGAVRHKGFIPWDNDVDISMPRVDYDKFLSLVSKEGLNKKYYRVVSNTLFGSTYVPFAKVIDERTELRETGTGVDNVGGIFIDIFPIDGYGMTRQSSIEQFEKCSKYFGRLKRAKEPLSNNKGLMLLKQLLCKVLYETRSDRIFKNTETELRKINFDKSYYVGSTFGMRGIKEIIEKKFFEDYDKMEFNGKKYRVPIGYKQYLKQMYGNYMQLPPVEKRIVPHEFDAFWRKESYK